MSLLIRLKRPDYHRPYHVILIAMGYLLDHCLPYHVILIWTEEGGYIGGIYWTIASIMLYWYELRKAGIWGVFTGSFPLSCYTDMNWGRRVYGGYLLDHFLYHAILIWTEEGGYMGGIYWTIAPIMLYWYELRKAGICWVFTGPLPLSCYTDMNWGRRVYGGYLLDHCLYHVILIWTEEGGYMGGIYWIISSIMLYWYELRKAGIWEVFTGSLPLSWYHNDCHWPSSGGNVLDYYLYHVIILASMTRGGRDFLGNYLILVWHPAVWTSGMGGVMFLIMLTKTSHLESSHKEHIYGVSVEDLHTHWVIGVLHIFTIL